MRPALQNIGFGLAFFLRPAYKKIGLQQQDFPSARAMGKEQD
jgi:hypothetical protein